MQAPLYGATQSDADEAKAEENSDRIPSRSITFPLVDFESKQVALLVRTHICIVMRMTHFPSNVLAVLRQRYYNIQVHVVVICPEVAFRTIPTDC